MFQTPVANRIHIGFFGRCNVGKSSIINAITEQHISTVSNISGTTTDIVTKTMELFPIGPVVLIDTPGIDDFSELGKKRKENTFEVLKKTDFAVLVSDFQTQIGPYEGFLIQQFKKYNIPYLIVIHKVDLCPPEKFQNYFIYTSIQNPESILLLQNIISKKLSLTSCNQNTIFGEFLNQNDIVVLITPIDESAPKNRLILPQVQTIRAILDNFAICITVQPQQLQFLLSQLKSTPKLFVTDSQAFEEIKDIIPEDASFTSFSILMAKYKGILEQAKTNVDILFQLKDNSKILICEGCTHQKQCNDIGTVKIPNLITQKTGKSHQYEFCYGKEFPNDLSSYSLIIHCGGCMLNEKEMKYRASLSKQNNIPFINYGVLFAFLNGLYERSLKISTMF